MRLTANDSGDYYFPTSSPLPPVPSSSPILSCLFEGCLLSSSWVSFLVSLTCFASAARPSPSGLSLWSARCPSSLCQWSSMSCASCCSRAPTNLLWSSTGSLSLAVPLAMALTPTSSSSTRVRRCAAPFPPPLEILSERALIPMLAVWRHFHLRSPRQEDYGLSRHQR